MVVIDSAHEADAPPAATGVPSHKNAGASTKREAAPSVRRDVPVAAPGSSSVAQPSVPPERSSSKSRRRAHSDPHNLVQSAAHKTGQRDKSAGGSLDDASALEALER